MRSLDSTIKVLSILTAVIFAVCILMLLWVMAIRIQYPFELEYLEGLSVDEAAWILSGRPLYQAPSIEFVPLVYSPLYFYAAAGFMHLIGVGFAGARLVSVGATVSTLALIFLVVKTTTNRNNLAGFAAAGLYAAMYRLVGTWMDVARPDSLFLAFLVAALFVSVRFPSSWGLLLSGLLYATAYHTKQPALPTILAMLVISPLVFGRKSLYQMAACIVGGVGSFLIFNWSSQGWFGFYTLSRSVRQVETFGVAKLGLFWEEVLPWLLPLLAVVGFFLIASVKETLFRKGSDRISWLPLIFSFALIATSWNIYLNEGTYSNGLMPAGIGFAMLTGLGLAWIMKKEGTPFRALTVAALILLIGQAALLFFMPGQVLPSEQHRKASEKFVGWLTKIPGEVLVYDHGHIGRLAGKNTFMHRAAYIDASGEGSPPSTSEENRMRQDMVRAALRNAVQDQIFSAIIVDDLNSNWLPYYIDATRALGLNESYSPVPLIGPSAQPKTVMLKNPLLAGEEVDLTERGSGMFLSKGWAPLADGERWGQGKRSTMTLPLKAGRAYQVDLQVQPFCFAENETQTIKIRWNEVDLGQFELPGCGVQGFSFIVPVDLVTEGQNTLWMRYKYWAEPGEDPGVERRLAVKFISLRVQPIEGETDSLHSIFSEFFSGF